MPILHRRAPVQAGTDTHQARMSDYPAHERDPAVQGHARPSIAGVPNRLWRVPQAGESASGRMHLLDP